MPKINKSNSQASKPYDKPNTSPKQTKLDYPSVQSPSLVHSKGKKSEYDKTLLVTLFLKSSKDADWTELGKDIGKTPIQCKDVWRKVIKTSLLTNKPWSGDGKDWTREMKIATLMIVLDSCNPDWECIAASFPGRTKSQLYDVWRKVILPRLKRGDTIE
ncbi:hypothetical protein I204_07183 [Kwoniella mangroviensis CBS 8886]|uniref:hypothetical protein n=1 Tax=Kwoniella mangroviensis CBS 8507 TaxID=1296122 RepID=UPI00080CE64A|nr:uncharacterized protein I203_05028 [Kwoniella mangroviensis CBS 8507]OCF66006.1 hypothetical protein I203_05028 [Kwoniella mangroviensis CBS 8507]OCF71920.1 hypothetical protein I204_07183 [Kwoniella mangroviensis CBS 8886]